MRRKYTFHSSFTSSASTNASIFVLPSFFRKWSSGVNVSQLTFQKYFNHRQIGKIPPQTHRYSNLSLYFLSQGKGRKCIYAALYFYPILIGVHAACGGLVYFCYPYLTLCLSLVTIAIHFAFKSDRIVSLRSRRIEGALDLLKTTVQNPRNLAIVIAHW